MDIESKIWTFTNAGTRKHAFLNGIALCRSNLRRDAGAVERFGENYCEVKTYGGICATCEVKFNAIIEAAETVTEAPAETVTEAPAEQAGSCTCEDRKSADHSHYLECPVRAERDETHPDAGTYNPMDGADYLKVQGLYVVAEVHTDGTYAVFVQSQRIDRGRLTGTEGSLMRFFTNIARMWSARIDDERAQEAARRAEAEYAHHAEAESTKSPELIVAVVEALGGTFEMRTPSGREKVTPANVVIEAILNAQQYGFKVEMRDNPEGHQYPWHVALLNGYGAIRTQYHYMGH